MVLTYGNMGLYQRGSTSRRAGLTSCGADTRQRDLSLPLLVSPLLPSICKAEASQGFLSGDAYIVQPFSGLYTRGCV